MRDGCLQKGDNVVWVTFPGKTQHATSSTEPWKNKVLAAPSPLWRTNEFSFNIL